MARKIRVGIVFGGRSCEHEVSLDSARSVVAAIDHSKYDLTFIHIGKDGEWRLPAPPVADAGADADAASPAAALPAALAASGASGGEDASLPILVGYPDGGRLLARGPAHAEPLAPGGSGAPAKAAGGAGAGEGLDVVFPLLHGPFGEDGTVQGLLELAGLPYVGAGVLGSAVAMDKAMMKRAFRAEGLPVVEYFALARSEWRRGPEAVRARAEAALGYPMFVKPANLGSSVGVHRIDGPGTFRERVEDAAAYDTRVLLEAAARDCREVECAVLGNDEPRASVVGEIVPSREFYDYDAKYLDDASQLVIPAPLAPATAERVRALALDAFRAVDARGLARVDFFVGREEGGGGSRVYVNEVNTMPGFTPISMYPKLWEASGIPYAELIDRLIELALEEHRDRRDVRSVL